MSKTEFTDGIGIPHGTFEKEFLAHEECSEWWYATGYVQDAARNLFGYQFTLARVKIWGARFHILICSVTDFQERRHYNIQAPIFFHKGTVTTRDLISVDGKASMAFSPNEFSSMGHMSLHMQSRHFCLDLTLEAKKPPVWHCEDGVLQMGVQNNPRERTYYYSFTNLAAKGSLTLGEKKYHDLSGKAWFDRQGGTYSLTKPECQWEWFSLRFFDDTEAMLFAFPQDGYWDGTYIEADGSYRRMNDYKLRATDVTTYNNLLFSNGWQLTMNGQSYTLKPKMNGMFNVSFFELLADIVDESGRSVGYCFVELLPGVRNKNSVLDAFRKKD